MAGSPVLTSIAQYPTKAYAGMFLGMAKDVESYINNAPVTAGVTDLVFTQTNSHAYTFTAYGIPVSYTSDGSATYAEIQAGLVAAIAAIPALVPLISAAASGNNLRVTELTPAVGSMGITGLDGSTTATVVTAHSQLEPMPAGIVIARGTGYQDGRLPRASGDFLVGVTVHQHAHINEKAYPGAVYPPNSMVSAARFGNVWCPTESLMALTDTVYSRYAAGAGGTQLGAIRNSADTSTAVSLSGKARVVQVLNSGLALIRFNLVP